MCVCLHIYYVCVVKFIIFEIIWYVILQVTFGLFLGAIVITTNIEFLMFLKSCSLAKMMGCCSCFGFIRKPKRKPRPNYGFNNHLSQELLLDEDMEDEDDGSYNGEVTRTTHADESEPQICGNRSEEILHFREQNGMICRQVPVKETHKCVRTEVNFSFLFCRVQGKTIYFFLF